MGVLFQIHFWDQSHVTIVWNTRETGDMNKGKHCVLVFLGFKRVMFCKWNTCFSSFASCQR